MADLADLVDLLAGRTWLALTGAGFSTDSGIPDYRGPDSPPANPMQYKDFLGSAAQRRRYWVRSFFGWPLIERAEPNAGHRALARLPQVGSHLRGVITQNVDGLHTKAGSANVLELHGSLAEVICLQCRALSARSDLQVRLAAANPEISARRVGPGDAELRPDGDLEVDGEADFVVPDCLACGGVLKPDVVFFGESVPKDRVARAYAMVDDAEVLVVLGSSLTVMSGLRFVRHDAKLGRPVAIVNRGPTRGDDRADVRLSAGTSEITEGLLEAFTA